MNKKYSLIGIIFVFGVIGISFLYFNPNSQEIQSREIQSGEIQSGEIQSGEIPPIMKIKELVPLNTTSLFKIFVYADDYTILSDGSKNWSSFKLEKNPINQDLYDQISSDGKTAVIYPVFTAAAYSEPGFYTFYRGECNPEFNGDLYQEDDCLTVKIKESYDIQFSSSGVAANVFWLLEYDILTDIDVHKNPELLLNYEKIILLHNEYVTSIMFDAITSHPKVIYLYPNALYAEVDFDEELREITLVRGHNYPDIEIRNGFDWEYDNSPDEYDVGCEDMKFSRINNGWMLNCYPENIIHKDKSLLEKIRGF